MQTVIVAAAVLAAAGVGAYLVLRPDTKVPAAPEGKGFYDFTLDSLGGKPTELKQYKGKVVLVVNTASKCGLTPQYAGLEKLYEDNKEAGLVVLGFPANDFGQQEPGTNKEISEFCTKNYGVTFPMFSKITVTGENMHPLYAWLLDQTDKKPIEWNFAKFLIGRDGNVIKRFPSKMKPEDPEIAAALKTALEAK
jgi:glutathione peroxidase